MATAAYRRWDAAGRPWRRARPVAGLESWAGRNGVRVLGTIGNDDHLTADWPEDHAPYSFTAYPVELPGTVGYVVCAIDLDNVRGLGAAILRDARAGRLPWLKFVNFGGMHYAWADGFREGRPNPDQHVHVSVFSDETETSIDTYDPLESGDMEPTDLIPIPQWVRDKWPDKGLQDGKIRAETAWASGYGHARSAKDQAYRNGAMLAELLAAQRAIIAAIEGPTSVDGATLRAIVRDELNAHRAELGEQLAAQLVPRVAEQLGQVTREQLGQAVDDALRAVLGSLDEQA